MSFHPTQERVFGAITSLLEDHEMATIAMSRLAQAAGLSRQALYLHFGSRSNLFVQYARHIDEKHGIAEELAPLRSANSGVEALAALAKFWASYTPKVYRVAWSVEKLRGVDEDSAEAWQDRTDARSEGNRILVQRLAAEGVLAEHWTVETATDWLYALTSFANWGYLAEDRGWSAAEVERHLRFLLHRTLLRNEMLSTEATVRGDGTD